MARPSSEKSLASLVGVFDALSDLTRLRIVLLLARAERHVNSLSEELKLGQPTVSHHLGLLRMHGLIVRNRKGKQVIYSLDPSIRVTAGRLKIPVEPYSVTVEGY